MSSHAVLHIPKCGTRPKYFSSKVVSHFNPQHARTGLIRLNMSTLKTIEENEKEQNASKNAKNVGNNAQKSYLAVTTDNESDLQYSIRLQLSLWTESFQEELAVYRSPAIASELLLQRVVDTCSGLRHPNILECASALMVLTNCLPLLGHYSELLRGVIQELSHVIFISPMKSVGISVNASTYGRKTFFDSFFEVVDAFQYHHTRSQKYSLMIDREKRVLDRAVYVWQKSLARRLLNRWRTITRRHAMLRTKYQKIFKKASQGAIVSAAIVLWRQYSHEILLRSLASVTSHTLEEIDVAKQREVACEHQLKKIQEETSRSENAVAESVASNNRIRKAISSQIRLIEAARVSCDAIIGRWIDTTSLLFGDAHKVPVGNHTLWVEEMVSFDKRGSTDGALARKRSTVGGRAKLSTTMLVKLTQKLLPSLSAEATRLLASAATSQQPGLAEQAEKVCLIFRLLTNGIPPPLQGRDIVRGDQLRIRGFLYVLMEMYGGGKCSLFFPNHREEWSLASSIETQFSDVPLVPDDPAEDEAPCLGVVFVSNFLLPGRHKRQNPDSNLLFESELMMDDWKRGKEILHECVALAQQTNKTLAEATEVGVTVQLHREAQQLFDILANVDNVILKESLEPAVQKFVSSEEHEVLAMLFPDETIDTVTDLLYYISDVAELLTKSPIEVIQLIEDNLDLGAAATFFRQLRDEEVQRVLRGFRDEISRAFLDYSTFVQKEAPQEGSIVGTSKSKIRRGRKVETQRRIVTADALKLFTFVSSVSQTYLPLDEMITIFNEIQARVPSMGEEAFVAILAAIAFYYDPNPFLSLSQKLKALFVAIFHF